MGNDPERVTSAVALYRERYGKQGWLETVVYPGITWALIDLQEAGATLFVGTAKPYVFADRILRHFDLQRFFRAVYGSEFDGTHANKGQLIAHLLKTESLSPHATVMVGDRAQDVIGALANGVTPIGTLWGYGSRQELTAAGAAIVCPHPWLLGHIWSSWKVSA